MKATIGKTDQGKELSIDIKRLLVTRMLLQADSGGGKTVALKRILEQTHSHVQQIVIDPEGEFSTLREKYDYLLCAPEGADAVANPKTATILARKLRETRVSAIIDIYDLRPQDQKHFVRLFVEELLAAPKKLWNPCLLVIDEAQVFAPENDKSESHGAIMDLRGRGRKRGLCPILATPRLAELSKDACAGLQNKLIGVTTLDLDVKRAARDLALTPVEATTMLRNLDPGEFFCFGPALTRKITKVKVGPIKTSHGQHTLGKDRRPPEPSDKIKAVLAKLADLPKEAEKEIRTTDDLRRENANLKRELTIAKRVQPADPAAVDQAFRKGKIEGYAEALRQVADLAKRVKAAINSLDTVINDIGKIELYGKTNILKGDKASRASDRDVARPLAVGHTPLVPKPVRRGGGGNGASPDLRKCDRAILTVLAQQVDGCKRAKLVLLSGYRYSGGFKNSLARLRSQGLIDGPNTGTMRITQDGLSALGTYELLPQGQALREYWLSQFGQCERAIMQALFDNQTGMNKDELTETTGYAYSGGFKNALARLRTADVITGPNTGVMRISDDLFEAAQ